MEQLSHKKVDYSIVLYIFYEYQSNVWNVECSLKVLAIFSIKSSYPNILKYAVLKNNTRKTYLFNVTFIIIEKYCEILITIILI